ncbi:MAG: twin-arginine translocation signal domain-containing protein [Acidobacteriia bacterium]|nr:twin-arginine translocation signal domain-containing protein [Terriglobia bacterium]MYC67747.1 twin-arginine translocation signal domain-containing protein [Terriglobia bacterium]
MPSRRRFHRGASWAAAAAAGAASRYCRHR